MGRKSGLTWSTIERGVRIEKEHGKPLAETIRIVLDHLAEHPSYYEVLAKAEKVMSAKDREIAAFARRKR